jgi:hypothetical protein
MKTIIRTATLWGVICLAHFSLFAQKTSPSSTTKPTNTMKEYVLIMRINPAPLAPDDLTDVRAKWKKIVDDWTAREIFVTSNQIVQEGVVVSGREGTARPGSVASDGLRIVSTINIRAASLEEAAALARIVPLLEYGGTVEIREKLN